MDTLELIMGITILLTSANLGVTFVWPAAVKYRVKKEYKYALQAISKYDGYLISQEKFLDNASLCKVEVENRSDLKILFPYIEKIANHVGEENLKLLYTNLKSTTLEKSKLRHGTTGVWRPTEKKILYREVSSLGHELLHVASSFYDEVRKEVQCGFSQAEEDECAEIGIGLNEGYTEYLTFQIFGEDKNSRYENLVNIAKLLELFFDDPKEMEKFYFGHDLPGFIHYMESFIPYDRMISIILSLDKIDIYEHGYDNGAMREIVKVEMELYRYFIASNPRSEKLEKFESIIKQKEVTAKALKREKKRMVKESLQNDDEYLDDFGYYENDLNYGGMAK